MNQVLRQLGGKIRHFDGAMGTMLQERGLLPGESPELWGLAHREEIVQIHQAYLEAGADFLKTNTFGANRFKLEGSGHTVEEVVTAGVEHALQAAGAEYGNISLLVYSAGYDFLAPAERTESADARYLFEVNFFGAAEALRAAAPFLRARRGRAVFVSSMADETVIPYNAFYCASKAALSMFARTADAELRSRGVRVSAILPGGTATGFTYRRKVYGAEACGDAFAAVRRVEAALAHEEQGGMQPARVAEEIVRLSERRSPPAVKAAGVKNALSRTAMRLVPARFADAFSRRKFAGRG